MSNPLRKMFETVPSLEEQGVIIQYGVGLEVKVARAGGRNKKYSRAMTRLSKPHRRAIQAEMLDETIGTDLLISVFTESVIKDWKGFTKDILTKVDDDAEIELEFTTENVIAVMKALPDLFADIVKMAQNIAMYRAEMLENDSKN